MNAVWSTCGKGENREMTEKRERKSSGCCVRWVPAALVQRLTTARHAATNCNVVVAACCNMLRGSKQKLLQLHAAADRKGLKRRVQKSAKLAREVEMCDEQWQPLGGAVGVAIWQVTGWKVQGASVRPHAINLLKCLIQVRFIRHAHLHSAWTRIYIHTRVYIEHMYECVCVSVFVSRVCVCECALSARVRALL